MDNEDLTNSYQILFGRPLVCRKRPFIRQLSVASLPMAVTWLNDDQGLRREWTALRDMNREQFGDEKGGQSDKRGLKECVWACGWLVGWFVSGWKNVRKVRKYVVF